MQFDDSAVAVGVMKEHGLDMADLNLGFDTNDMTDPPIHNVALTVERAARVKREVGHADPFPLVPEDWSWWRQNPRGHAPSIGWPEVSAQTEVHTGDHEGR